MIEDERPIPQESIKNESIPREHTPVADIGVATIEFLSGDGLNFQTRQSLRSRDPGSPYPLSPEQTDMLRHGMKGEPLFVLRDILNDEELQQLKSAQGNEDKLAIMQHATRRVRRKALANGESADLASKFIRKAGLRNIRIEPDGTITFDTRPVSYKAYEAASKPTDSPESLEFGMATGVSAVVRTKNRKLVLQYRGKGNSLYGDIPGASAAGLLDGEMERIVTDDGVVKTGRLKAITTETFHNAILKEMGEEIAVGREHVVDIRTLALADDKRKRHIEANHMIELDITDEELAEMAMNAPRSKTRTGELIDFDEKFIVIDEDDLDKIFELKTPLPPSHMTNFLAAGYYITYEKSGAEAADAWLQEYSQKAKHMYEDIDKTVREYYSQNPEALNDVPPGKPQRNPDGYDPAYLPEQQGLPSFQSEVERVGLVKQYNEEVVKNGRTSIEKEEQKEISERRDIALMFDLDGVLTNPDTKIVNRENVAIVARELKSQRPVAFATGRAYQWVEENIMPALLEELEGDVNLLNLLFVSCEKGGLTVKYESGKVKKQHIEGVAVPEDLLAQLRDRIPAGQGVFDDTAKETMFTVEIEGGDDAQKVAAEKDILQSLKVEYDRILEGLGYETDLTEIALDVQKEDVNKRIAAEEFRAFLQERYDSGETRIHPQEYFHLMIGDGPSDGKAVEYLREHQFNAAFGYVGEKPLQEDLPYEVIRPVGGKTFDQGANSLIRQLGLLE
jgi:hydroxymethylpyrimidine pyrophosphatase-like HAD family hydrolase